jgi:ComF family protein
LRAAFVYEGLARELVQSLKYRGLTALAEPMAALAADSIRKAGLTFDVLVPVPLAGMRERTRGYNQAEALAKQIGRALGVEVAPWALRRIRSSPPQARSADAETRRRNVQGAFRARNEAAGRSVLLVDDVTTTGATLAACASALKEAGAGRVWAFAFGRED